LAGFFFSESAREKMECDRRGVRAAVFSICRVVGLRAQAHFRFRAKNAADHVVREVELRLELEQSVPVPGREGLGKDGGSDKYRRAGFCATWPRERCSANCFGAIRCLLKGDDVVCVQRPEPFGKLIFTLEWIANNRIPIGPKQNNFWKVNMKNGSAMKLGECLTTARSPV